ncbi:MAG TPA: energy transducer TonB [Labilithrix sp.]|jgi:hypothetical protein
MASKAPTPSLGPPAGVPPSNAKYVVIAVVLLLLIGAAVVWKLVFQKEPPPIVQVDAGPPPPVSTPTRDDDVPPPPPSEDAGPDAGKRVNVVAMGNGCEQKVCKGGITSELENTLAFRATSTKKRCYYPALAQDSSLKGRATIAVRVGANGQICSASVAGGDPAIAQVARCTASNFAGTVPAPKGGACVDVQVPINYTTQ